MKKQIEQLLDKKINELFAELQDSIGITSGDTLPEQELELDEAKEKLVKIIEEIIEFEKETNGIGE